MSQPNVILIVLDTVRADRVSALGYDQPTTPAFDEFVQEATLYTDAIAQGSWSIPSHASIFTGKYPREHGATTAAPILQDHDTLAVQLSKAGYETYANSPNEYVRPATGFGRGFDEFDPCSPVRVPAGLVDLVAPVINWGTRNPRVRLPIERLFNQRRANTPRVTGREIAETDSQIARVTDYLTRASEPFFCFVNLMDAHLPRSPAPDHYDRFVDDDLDDVTVVENERAHTFGERLGPDGIEKMNQLYDADLRTMDDKLGELLAVFERMGVLEDSLVVLVSDHGEQLGEFGMIGHQASLFDEVVHVPLAISFPDGDGGEIDDQVEIRRLYETVLDVAGVEPNPEQSLAAGQGDEVAQGAFISPSLDLERLLWEQEVVYDPAYMGTALTFERTDGLKQLRFGDAEWLFECPESGSGSIGLDARRRLDGRAARETASKQGWY